MKKQKMSGFSNIATDEFPLLATIVNSDSPSLEHTLLTIEAIDDLLTICKMKPMMLRPRKNQKSFKQVLDGRIGKLVVDLSDLAQQPSIHAL